MTAELEREDERDASPFVHDWTDSERRERYQYNAREKYEFYKYARAECFKANVDYGKWLLASGLAVHGGAIYAINSLKEPNNPQLLAALLNAAKWNVAGIIFVLLAGLMGWLNFQFACHIYNKWADPLMVYRTDKFPVAGDEKRDPVAATRLLAIASGGLAMWALIASAANIFTVFNYK